MPEPDDDGSGDEVSDHSEDLPEEYPDDEYDSWEDEHEDDLDDPDEKRGCTWGGQIMGIFFLSIWILRENFVSLQEEERLHTARYVTCFLLV